MLDLKSCPFCGGEAELKEGEREYFAMCMIYCMKCGINTGLYDYEEEAIDIWQTRIL